MHHVLIIAYIFPPLGGSGVQRTTKFVRYLPEFGWQPVVLTVSDTSLSEVDISMLSELPADLPIYRAPDVRLPQLLRKAARRMGLISSPVHSSVKLDSPISASPSAKPVKSGLRRALSRFADVWLQIPDQFVYWFPAALRVGLKVIQQCDVIYSTSDPFTDHLVAWFLHKISGKPWIADFRDPWTQDVIYQHSSRLRSWVDAFFERQFLKTPQLITVTCAATATGFQRLVPSVTPEKFVEITNGFDAEDFKHPNFLPPDRFTITFTGRFDGKKNASVAFLSALRDLHDEHPELASEIKVIFAGAFGGQLRTLLKEWKLEEFVETVGYVSHNESVKRLFESHILLLTLNAEPGMELIYPGKLFEYLAAGKTILALVPEGATADFVRTMGAGIVVTPDDVAGIKQAIFDLYGQYKQGATLSKTYDNLGQFERRALAGRLAKCLDSLLPGDKAI